MKVRTGIADRSMIIVFVCAALFCVLFSGCGSMRKRPIVSRLAVENWYEVRSPEVVLHAQGSRENAEKFAIDLARFMALVEKLVRVQTPKTPAQIYLGDGRTRALFIPSRRVGGFMSHTLGGFDGFVAGAAHDPGNRHILLHEFTHYLSLRNTRLSYPSWYTEGFAELLGPTRTRGDLLEFGSRPPGSLQALQWRRSGKKPIDLEEIFAFTKTGKWRYPDDFYAISWATVHYLNTTPELQRRLVSMIELQGRGVPWKRAYARSFDEPISALSAKVEEHVTVLFGGVPVGVHYIPIEDLDVRDDFEIRKLPPHEALRLLGELALRGAVYTSEDSALRLAEGLFERSLDLQSSDSRTQAGLASALAAQEDFAQAEEHLAFFYADSSPSVEAMIHAGNSIQLHALSLRGKKNSAQREARHEAAIAIYHRALESNPKSAFAMAGLGKSQLETGAYLEAHRALAEAQDLGEWDARLTLDRGRVEQKLGSVEDARAFWKEVIRLGTDEDAKRANALLEELESPE